MEIFNACARTLFRFFFSATIDSSRRHHQAAWDSREFWSWARVKSSSTSYTHRSEREEFQCHKLKITFSAFSLLLLHTNDEVVQRQRHRENDTTTTMLWPTTIRHTKQQLKNRGRIRDFIFPWIYIIYTQKKRRPRTEKEKNVEHDDENEFRSTHIFFCWVAFFPPTQSFPLSGRSTAAALATIKILTR